MMMLGIGSGLLVWLGNKVAQLREMANKETRPKGLDAAAKG